DMQLFVHRMNQTAHISLQCLQFSNSVETKMTGCALYFLARPASVTSDFFLRLVALVVTAGPSGAPLLRRRRFGEGVFTSGCRTLQPLFSINRIFF
ncbi:MAG: hypothetical protein AAF754_00775, partial [Pseudomonadota bacterium]